MAWDNLYRWEKGFEPRGILELRKEKNKQVRECQIAALEKQNAKIKSIAVKVIGKTSAIVSQSAFDATIVSAVDAGIKIGNCALKRRLKSFGYDVSNVQAKNSGWPKSWPKHVSNFVAHWIESGYIVKAFDADEFVFVEDIANRCIQQYIREFEEDDIADFVSARSLRRALEIKGYESIKVRDGMIALIGYRLAKG